MSESTLKFGPEWLRNLSQGTNVSSPPPSPGLALHAPKFKLAEYRYGREEMLAIFPKDIKMPPDLKQFTGMHKEQYQLPVTLVALTEEEQKIWTRSVNSDAVLRLMGKGTSAAPTGVAAPRGGGRGGGSVDRGRGRGRATYFQRGPSLEDGGENAPPGIFTRQRSYERPTSLSERGAGWEERERRYEKGFPSREEEPIAPGRKENLRGSLDWRSSNQRDRDRDGEDDAGWRVSGSRFDKWGRTVWRSDRVERGEHDDPNSEWSSNGKVAPRKSNTSRTWNDEHPGGDVLPEWSTDDNQVSDSVGTFDATGAFMETKNDDRKVKLKEGANNVNTNQDASHHDVRKSHSTSPAQRSPNELGAPPGSSPEPKNTTSPSQSQHNVLKLDTSKESDVSKVVPETIISEDAEVNSNPTSCREKSHSPTHKKEEVNFEHLEKAAESLVDTWTAEEDEKVDASHISNSSLSPWFYRDPQGTVQGPFSDSEMAEWFRTGYFNMSLLVRRGLDGRFCPLGELVKQWGCVPFLSSTVPVVVQPSPPVPVQPPQVPQPIPSMQASVLTDLLGPTGTPIERQTDLTSDHDQQVRILQQQLLHQQLIQQQHLLQQQQQMYLRQQLQQVLGGLKPADGFSPLSSQQQQQQFYLLQRVLAQQQQNPSGVVPRPAVENNSMSDPVRQFLAQLAATQSTSSKDDSQSLWNMQARTPRPEVGARWAGMHNQQSSVWDLDASTVAPRETSLGPSHVHPDVLEQEKKLLEEQQKKRLNEEEMLRKQEEELHRRQLEEEERIREEIRQREEEEERIRLEELLRQQREMEERRQKEAEERKLKEQELRRIQEEEKRRQEEREKEERLQQELFQRQEEEKLRQQREFLKQEELRKREEYRRQEEEKQRLEEEKLKLEHQREAQRQAKLQQQEALKRLQKQQKSKPQAPAWGGQTAKPSDNSLSLTEIQKLQEEKERQERIEWEMQQHLIQQQIQQQQQQAAQQAKAISLTWANRANSNGGPVKSLLEIQQEEADKLAQEQEKEQQVKKQQQQANNVSLPAAGVWSNSNNHLLRANSSPSSWSFENSISNSHSSGFWDDDVPISNGSKVQPPQPNKAASGNRYAALANNTMSNGNGQVGKSRMLKARKEEETVMKLFEGHTQSPDEFTKWCNQTLRSMQMQSTIDVPTFIGFLKDVESPYDVYDYVRVYLGESKEAHNFAKQFLEKRSKYRNQDHKKEENMWGPAPAITPSLSKLQPSELEGPKVAGAKRKKKRMQKLDNTILGFTVHASMDRVNVGDIDHGEDI